MSVPSASTATLTYPVSQQPPNESMLESALTTTGAVLSADEFRDWLAWRRRSGNWQTSKIDFSQLDGWSFDEVTGALKHRSGRFFTVEGLAVQTDLGPIASWAQPIIHQNEIGILGILVKRINGVLHCLMQAKMEPGNINQLQISPTVQATQSNYTRVHNGSSIPYLEYFSGPRRGRVLVDVLQSEQGAWFYHKRNRNMVVETTEDVPVLEDFCWVTIGQLRKMLLTDDLVNMPGRTVLSCMPLAGPALAGPALAGPGEGSTRENLGFGRAVAYSLSGLAGSLHPMRDVLSWLTDAKSRYALDKRTVPLAGLPGWHQTASEVVRDDERFFKVIAVSVDATTREVRRWTQPMVEPVGLGVAGFLVKRIDGVVHVLAHARLEAGYLDGIEIGPTVHYLAGRHVTSAGAAAGGPGQFNTDERPRYLNEFLSAPPSRVRFDVIQSEEGGRFYHARNRYMVVETTPQFPVTVPEDYRWVSVHQLAELVTHSRYLNVEARTLMACLNSLW